MTLTETHPGNRPALFHRRRLFGILPAATAGCLGCARAAACPQAQEPPSRWTENAGMTWEQIFRFAYQKDLIPLLKAL